MASGFITPKGYLYFMWTLDASNSGQWKYQLPLTRKPAISSQCLNSISTPDGKFNTYMDVPPSTQSGNHNEWGVQQPNQHFLSLCKDYSGALHPPPLNSLLMLESPVTAYVTEIKRREQNSSLEISQSGREGRGKSENKRTDWSRVFLQRGRGIYPYTQVATPQMPKYI